MRRAFAPTFRRDIHVQASNANASTLLIVVLAAPLLAGCPKIFSDSDADAAAEAAATAVATPDASAPAAPSATVEPSAEAKRDPRSCKPGQTAVKVKGAQGVDSQCQQLCGAGLNCTGGQACTGSTIVPGQHFCVNIRPGANTCKAGEKLVQGSAATLFNCVTPCRADTDCPKQSPSCGRDLIDDLDNPAIKFRICGEQAAPAPSSAPSAASAPTSIRLPNSALNTPTPDPPPPATKLKCVLPSPPPCAAPHVASPKELCQLPCSNGSCAACGGTCQTGFCVGG